MTDSNITWSKTIANWGVNAPDFDPDAKVVVKEKVVVSFEDLTFLKKDLVEKCAELVKLTSGLYEVVKIKELYDAEVTLKSALRVLNLVPVIDHLKLTDKTL